MHNFNVLGWKIRGFFREMYKMKFYATYRYFFETEYRNDVNYMLNLVRKQQVTAVDTEVKLESIQHSHSINYPGWVEILRSRIRDHGAESLESIKVFFDEETRKYLVVDGNHRFAALLAELGPLYRIKVVLLVPVKQKEVAYESI